ncbi:hypothetical protein [Streptomyces sp. NPDC092295]|uniref:hypothetical protein n=1 Tax=Streptomyces sp. NPDC092295 TaxID=3366011 RepID=UPI0037F45EFF
MVCAICPDGATHYYRTVGGADSGRCGHHANRFGYPQYLVELNPPKHRVRQSGYLVQVFDGTGVSDPVAEVWPFEEEVALIWVGVATGCDRASADWLVADAIWAAYEPQQLEAGELSVEVTKVTRLLLI